MAKHFKGVKRVCCCHCDASVGTSVHLRLSPPMKLTFFTFVATQKIQAFYFASQIVIFETTPESRNAGNNPYGMILRILFIQKKSGRCQSLGFKKIIIGNLPSVSLAPTSPRPPPTPILSCYSRREKKVPE